MFAEPLVESRPGCGPVLAAVAADLSAGDSVALHHVPHARAQLSHVSPERSESRRFIQSSVKKCLHIIPARIIGLGCRGVQVCFR